MPYRYAVLYEHIPGRQARPVGLAVERDGYVRVEARVDLCIPKQYRAPFTVAGADMTTIMYQPGDPQYFDQVLIDLSRAFAITDVGAVEFASDAAFLRLLNEKVLRPLRYQEAHQYPAIQDYRRDHGYVYERSSQASDRPATGVRAPQGSLVAA